MDSLFCWGYDPCAMFSIPADGARGTVLGFGLRFLKGLLFKLKHSSNFDYMLNFMFQVLNRT
jgi:hypothetical protein